MFDEARAHAAQPGIEQRPLAGLSVSVRDLFDLRGQPTPAGSAVLADAPCRPGRLPCSRSVAPVGASVVGPHMVEFAFSGGHQSALRNTGCI